MDWKLSACAAFAITITAQLCHADTLRDIYESAQHNDAKLRAAEATFRADREIENQARSRLLPQVNGEASYGYLSREQHAQGVVMNGTPPIFGSSKQSSDLDTRDRIWGVNLSQPLFDVPAWFAFKSGKQRSHQAEAQFAYDQQDLVVRVADAYFAVLRNEDNLQASLAEERATKRQLDQSQKRFDVGLIPITDVDESRAAFDATVALRVIDEGNVARALEGLAALTGQRHYNLWRLDRNFPISEATPNTGEAWVEFSLKNNYLLKAALFGMQAAEANADSKRAEHLPKISATLSYQDDSLRGTQDTSPNSIFSTDPDADTTTRAAMIKLTVPIFTGGYTSSAQRQAAEQYNVALERRIDAERTAVQLTRSGFIAVGTDVQRVKARAQSITSARSALDATRAGYDVGTRNVVDVLQSQRVLYNAARDHANARYDYVLDTLRLKQNAGTLTPQDIYDLNKWLVAPDAPTASAVGSFDEKTDNSAPPPAERSEKKSKSVPSLRQQ